MSSIRLSVFRPLQAFNRLTHAVSSEDDLTSVEPFRPEADLAEQIVWETKLTHYDTVLLPHAANLNVRVALRRCVNLTVWAVEEDVIRFADLVDDPYIDWQLRWRMDFQEWADQFDPGNSLVQVIISTAPPYRAAADMVRAFDYLHYGHGRRAMVTFLPQDDFLGPGEDADALWHWLARRSADVWKVPHTKIGSTRTGAEWWAVRLERQMDPDTGGPMRYGDEPEEPEEQDDNPTYDDVSQDEESEE